VDENRSFVENHQIAERVESVLKSALPYLSEVTIHLDPAYQHESARPDAAEILPPRYQGLVPSAAPMGVADILYDADGNAAWDEIWTGFCDLALAGGPPHRGTLLEPVEPNRVAADPENYARVIRELERGIRMVTGLSVVHSATPGWIGMACESDEMALWLLRAIIVENVSVRREDNILYFPAGPDFRLEKEIKNVVTVIAKTTHYWKEHQSAAG
jgi:sirohydrochlorin cobaltochelatase